MQKTQEAFKIPSGAFPGALEFNFPVLLEGDAEFSLANPDFLNKAWKGLPPFDKKISNLRWVTGYGAVANAAMVLDSSPLKSVADMKGKKLKVGLSTKGSGGEVFALLQMAELGITPKTIEADGGVTSNLAYAAMADALANRTLDVCWLNTPLSSPHSSLILAEQRFGLRILEMPPDALDALVKREPYISKAQVAGGVYKGNPKPITLAGDPWGAVTRADLSDDFIYNFLKVIYADDVAKRTRTDFPMWNRFGEMEVALMGANLIPMHPGAARFFTEKGVDLKAKGIEVLK
ncbi:MAG: TAXI family TRAP transporter solute-binding subunit [Chloroflexota bacterium]